MNFLDLIFPKFCIGCKKWGYYICAGCRKRLTIIDSFICPVCHEFTYPSFIHTYCHQYTYIEGIASVLKYTTTTRKIIKAIKYQLIYDIYRELVEIILKSKTLKEFKERYPSCFLQPIPLHKKRYNMRGFNQAAELAKLFSHAFDYSISNVLTRNKDTKPQAQLSSKKQRSENLKNAFMAINNNIIPGNSFILVDDIYTSGSTCLEAAKILKSEKASHVFVWSLARD